MSWLSILIAAWIFFAVVGGDRLYVGYGFVMSAIRDRDLAKAAGVEFGIVERVDGVIASRFVLLDAFYNMIVMPVICLDLRLAGWWRMATVRGYTLPVPDVVTARLNKYYDDPNEWAYRKRIAAIGVMFLDRKDPKGWHVADPRAQTEA